MSRISLIFVNPIEYHGPHLPLTTDFDISRGLWSRFEAELKKSGFPVEVISRREIHRGCEPAPGPGSESTSLSELRQIVLKASQEAELEKPDLVLFMTFHGAPKHAAAIESSIRYLRSKGVKAYNPFNWVLQRHRDFDPGWVSSVAPLIEDVEFRKEWIGSIPRDFHGGLFETSVLMALEPDAVSKDYRSTPDCPEREISPPLQFLIFLLNQFGMKTTSRELSIGADAMAWMKHKTYYGYTGKPRLASPAIGEGFIRIILPDYVKGFISLMEGSDLSPKPILQWSTVFY